jgi:benzodiazapine receptor
MKNTQVEIIKLLVSIVVCQLAGVVGGLATAPAIPVWYAALNKPSFNPPNWLFAPVWLTLYTIMGIAVYLVWRKGFSDPATKTAIIIFVIQLVFNMLWSIVFFGLRSPLAGFVVIMILLSFITLTILRFYRISTWAALLLVPYLIWVTFAAELNFSIYMLNR